MPKLIKYARDLEKIDQINSKYPAFKDLYLGIEIDISSILELRKWYKSVREEYGSSFSVRSKFVDVLVNMDRELARDINTAAKHGLLSDVKDVLSKVNILKELFPTLKSVLTTKCMLSGNNSPISKLQSVLESLLDSLGPLISKKDQSIESLIDKTKKLEHTQKRIMEWDKLIRSLWTNPDFINLSTKPGEFSSQMLSDYKRTKDIASIISKAPLLLRSMAANPSKTRYHEIVSHSSQLDSLIKKNFHAENEFLKKGDVNIQEWKESVLKNQINSLIDRNQRALEHPVWINSWLAYINTRQRLSSKGLEGVINQLELNHTKSKDLKNIIQMVMSHQLSKEIFSENEFLQAFSGYEQDAVRQKFKEYDKKILDLQREKIAFNASREKPLIGNAIGRVSSFTEVSLIKHEAKKKTRHISIRRLLERAGPSIQTLKPCFMMSPMSVAQYLGTEKKFDIVIMDEASQIRPENALGAIARSKSLVVVGDPKQLPPTDFFRSISNNEDDDSVAMKESESILGAVSPLFKNRRLCWHYRSKHESLIAFSNKHYYDSNLILFPSPSQESEEFGIKFNKVDQGLFVNGRNIVEADKIIKSVVNHLVNNPEESVGVVAMNAKQRDEIENRLDQYIKDHPEIRDAYDQDRNKKESLFIKNLEGVQGDERDVIIISMTYGPHQIGAQVMQRFGPINFEEGWRRLNVLFTRSKKRMHIFSSMNSNDILVSENSRRGVRSLRDFLEYCENGHLHHKEYTGRHSDSDFEVAVMSTLESHGYKCEPQLGVAGYFLDLAVRDPGRPGRFLMGIECDGATYHSAKSARDRDRLRQEILEGLGWNIRRIWSTDWFKNPEAQIQPIIKELNERKTPIKDPNIVAQTHLRSVDSKKAPNKVIENPIGDSQSKMSLKDQLLRFNNNVIKNETPEVPDNKRLLRPKMIEAILQHMPCSKSEFLEYIPRYLRIDTDSREGKYLEQVLKIIVDDQSDSASFLKKAS